MSSFRIFAELVCWLLDAQGGFIHAFGTIISDQRRMGFTMRVERSSVDAVKSRFAALKEQARGSSSDAMAAGTRRGGTTRKILYYTFCMTHTPCLLRRGGYTRC